MDGRQKERADEARMAEKKEIKTEAKLKEHLGRSVGTENDTNTHTLSCLQLLQSEVYEVGTEV
jgi:hypothetical protein